MQFGVLPFEKCDICMGLFESCFLVPAHHHPHSLKVDFSLDKGTKKVNILFVNRYLVTSGKLEMVEFFKA